MERVTNEVVEAVKSRMEIVDVISAFVQLKRSGKSLVGLSPFTNEKTPSFTVDPQKQTFRDYSSGKSGDVIAFVREHEKLSFHGAIEWLAKRYAIPLDQGKPTQLEITQREIRHLNKKALNFFLSNFAGSIAHDYMILRSFTEETLEKFKIGYSPKGWTALTQHLKDTNQDVKKAADVAYIICHDPIKRRYFDRFRNRVIFPWINEEGKVIAFGGRILEVEEEKPANLAQPDTAPAPHPEVKPVRKNPKYINSPTTPIFSKDQTFYGLHLAAREIRKTGIAYAVEGYTDVMALHQQGLINTVGTAGTAFTKSHAWKLKQLGAQKVIVFFDPDQAGQSATERGIDLLLRANLSVKIVAVEQTGTIKLDPAEFAMAHTPETLMTYLTSNEQDFVVYMANKRFRDRKHMDPDQKVAATKEILYMISALKDTMLIDSYLKECAKIVDMSMESMRGPLNEMIQERADKEKREKEEKATKKILKQIDPNQELAEQIVTFILSTKSGRLANGQFPIEFLKDQLRNTEIQDHRIIEVLMALMQSGMYSNINSDLIIKATEGDTKKLVEQQVGTTLTLTELLTIRIHRDTHRGLYDAFAVTRYYSAYGIVTGMQRKLSSMSPGAEKDEYQQKVDWLVKQHATMGEAMKQNNIPLPNIPSPKTQLS